MQDMKAFWLGTLSTIVENDTCPFCRLVVHAINDSWMTQYGDVWSTANMVRINIWAETTFWAHSDNGEIVSDKIPVRHGRFRFRPALGTDWTSEEREDSWRDSTRSTICELDRISIEQYHPFPSNRQQDRFQALQRRLVPSVTDISLIRSWIVKCSSEHHHFGQAFKSQAQLRATGQFRVYDVLDSRLVEPTGIVSYIALSYVWGNAIRERQAAEPISWWSDLFDDDDDDVKIIHWVKRSRSVRFHRLPIAIQDACELVKYIGRSYLWVDLLCVSQDDRSTKELLINKMHVIYEGADLTLVAAGGNNADSRLHGLHKDTRYPESTWIIPTESGKLNLAIARPELPEVLSSTPWMTRGWTFQEDILSLCCLYFTPKEIFYSCEHHTPRSYMSGVEYYRGFGTGRFSEWREGYVLETNYTKTAYQNKSPWSEAWARSPTRSLRSSAQIIQQSRRRDMVEDINVTNDASTDDPSYNSDFNEYADFIRNYTKQQLTETGDIISAFLGILNKFSTKSPLCADVQFHGLLNYDLYRTSMEKSLL